MQKKTRFVLRGLYALLLLGIGVSAFYAGRHVFRRAEYSVFLPSSIVAKTEGYPSRGGPEALAEMVVYGDFECKYTRKMDLMVDTLLDRYPNGELRVFTKIRPLSGQPVLRLRARAAYAAHLQGEFYEMRRELKKITLPQDERYRIERLEEQIVSSARLIGLDMEIFTRDLRSPAVTEMIEQTISETSNYGIHSYPSALFEGVVYEGARPVSSLIPKIEATIQSHLEKPATCNTCGDDS